MKRVIDCLIFVGVLLGFGAQAQAQDWRLLARQDIEAAYRVAMADHTGSADDRNPGFAATAENARERALALAARADSFVRYGQSLKAFFSAFEDYHFGVYFPTDESLPARQWAGIIVVPQGEHLLVVATHPSLEAWQGDRILACDGQTATQLYAERVKPFLTQPDIAATRRGYVSDLFLSRSGEFHSRLEQCTFASQTGDETRALRWDFEDAAFRPLRRTALRGERPTPGVREFQPGRWWINASNFNPRDDEEQAAVETMLAQLREHAQALRSAESIVVDIRGNGGGSSAYGDQIVDIIWGDGYRDARLPATTSYVDWRVSPGNLAHMNDINEMIVARKFPQDVVDFFAGVRLGMIAAADAGQAMYRQTQDESEANEQPGTRIDNQVSGDVYFLTNINCGSACLDFADVMLSLENVTQIGQTTTADTQYMEVREQVSPSGKASFVIPVKVYRDRLRAPKQAYTPSIFYEGLDWGDAAIENWVSSIIDKRS